MNSANERPGFAARGVMGERPVDHRQPITPNALASIAAVKPLAHRKMTVCRMIDISSRTLDRLIGAGRFPRPDAYAGKAPLWRHETLERWLSQGGSR
jgi:hypothetical protein